MTQTNKNNFKRTIRICYPAGTGTLVIRTDLDWGRDINPVTVSSDGNTATFEIEAQQRFVHFKPCLIKNGSLHWAVGPDNLLIMAGDGARPVYPYFFSDSRPSFKLNQRYLEDSIACEFTCRPATTRTRRHVTPSPTCRTDRTSSFPRKHFDTSIGKSTKRVRFCGLCGQSKI